MRKQRTENREQSGNTRQGLFCSLFTVHCSRRASRGFTLVEMIVAVALFAIVMVVAVGALLSLTGANKKAQAIQSVMNNLNITLDSMVRNIRMGTEYHCGSGSYTGNGNSDSCASPGDTIFTFTCNTQTPSCAGGNPQWTYRYDADGSVCGQEKAICKSTASGWSPITSPEVDIDELTFYVVGTNTADKMQPAVVIVVSGMAGGQDPRTKTDFHIQATAVQRELDL